MTNLIGFHFQKPITDWPEAVAMLPDGTPVKVFQVQMGREVKAHNPGAKAIFRYHDDTMQHFDNAGYGSDWETELWAAKDFFNRWLDETFYEWAESIDYCEGWNETLANSQTQLEQEDRTMAVMAKIEVWRTDYADDPRLSHIKLILANAAVGNDIPLDMARAVYDSGHVMGYHPYVPIQHGEHQYDAWIMEDEWRWYSGRWASMDAYYRQYGIYLKWMGTEFGLVRAVGESLQSGDGWVDRRLWGGRNVAETLKVYTEYWANNTASWNAAHNNRYLGSVIFTSGGDGWNGFEIDQPKLGEMAAALVAFHPSTVPVPPPPEPEPDPPTPPEPEPEVRRYARTVVLLHPSVGEEWKFSAMRGTVDILATVGFSADDAGINAPELTSRTVIAVNADLWTTDKTLKQWLDLHYPGVVYVKLDADNPQEMERKLKEM